jgi:cyclopropane-fatty-acyl-phospholipid synthase
LYIFPDGELVSIATVLAHAEQAGFEVRDLENLREHYRLTVKEWLHRLEMRAQTARHLAREIKYRMWRLYLAGSTYYFRKAWLDLYHVLFVKTQNGYSLMPLTRTD